MAKVKKEDIDFALLTLHSYNINVQTREIFLHPYIGEISEDSGEVDYRMAVVFLKNLRFLENQSTAGILIHQHSPGGNVCDGMGIYDAIRASICPITMLSYAHARSMSSIIFQAADLRILTPNCIFLAHHGTFYIEDRTRPTVSNAERLKVEMQIMLNIYASRCRHARYFKGSTTKQITDFIDEKLKETGDWIMEADAAVKYGFADGVLGKGKYKTMDKIWLK